MRYTVSGRIRFISHLDLMRAFKRACIKNNIPVAVSCGYSPHLKLSFGPPKSVGVSSSCEYVDIYLEKVVPVEKLKKDLQEGLPKGIRIDEVNEVSSSLPALSAVINAAVCSVIVPQKYLTDADDRIHSFLNKKNIVVERKNKLVDIRPLTGELKLESDGRLFMHIALGQKGNVKPIEVISSLWPELGLDELKLWKVHREKLLGVLAR